MDSRILVVCLLKLSAAMLVLYMVRCEDEGEPPGAKFCVPYYPHGVPSYSWMDWDWDTKSEYFVQGYCTLLYQHLGVEERKSCQGNHHVCTTLMKYPDGYVANEGPYCKCSAGDCGSAWSEDDGRALTWKHYERVHWKVQYRFCKPIVHDNRPVCDTEELAAVIKTEVAHWKPYMEDEIRCRCRDGIHHMTGWRKDGNVWKYFYHCHKKECEDSNSECARILVDTNKKSDIVREVIFNCACKHGYLCPAKIKDESKVEGKEVVVRCEKVQQSNNKNEKLKQSKRKD